MSVCYKCDHCCFSCSPKVEKTIPTANLHKYIDQAAEIDSFRLVVFTGGECFLLGDDLDALVRRASGHKFLTRFVSNGYRGYLEDRRPSSQGDPYKIAGRIIETIAMVVEPAVEEAPELVLSQTAA